MKEALNGASVGMNYVISLLETATIFNVRFNATCVCSEHSEVPILLVVRLTNCCRNAFKESTLMHYGHANLELYNPPDRPSYAG
jgi:hypothetical protein